MPSNRNSETSAPPLAAVLATFAETLLSGRRVAILGDSANDLGDMAASSSGRRVHVFDPDKQRVGAAIASHRGDDLVSRAALDDDLDVHVGAFDAVIIPDLVTLDDSKSILARAAALLSKRGVLLLAAPNPDRTEQEDAIGYYDLYDLVAAHFEYVSMFGQAPFAGYTVANFAIEGEPAVTIDASLVDGAEEPTMFVAVASNLETEVDPYMLVQVPAPLSDGEDVADDGHAALMEAQLQRSLVAAELDKTREKEQRASQLAHERAETNKKLSARLSDLEDHLERQTTKSTAELRRANKAVETLQRRLRTSEGELQRRGEEVDVERALAAQREELEDAHQEDLDKMLERIAELEDDLETSHVAKAKADQDLAAAKRNAAADLAAAKKSAAAEVAAAKKTAAAQVADANKSAASEVAAAKKNAAAEVADANKSAASEVAAAKRAASETSAKEAAKEASPPEASPVDVRGFEFQISELKKALADARADGDVARREAKDMSKRLKEATALRKQRDEAVAERDQLRALAAGSDEEGEHAAEVEKLEAQLVERGQQIQRLGRDLRESERIGRELLAKFLGRGVRGFGNNGIDEALKVQLATLTERCTRYEADLRAATWKVESLTSSLQDGDAADHEKLEEALRVAHEDLASLRKQLAERR